MTVGEYKHDPACEQYRHLPVNEMNQCCACVSAVGARTEGWYAARAGIKEAADRLNFSGYEREIVDMVVQLAENLTPRDFFHPTIKSVLRERDELLAEHPANRTGAGDCVMCGSQPDLRRKVDELEMEIASLRTVIAAISYDGNVEGLIAVTQKADAVARAMGYHDAHEDCSAVVRPLEGRVQSIATALKNATGYAHEGDPNVLDRMLVQWADSLNEAVDEERAARKDLITYAEGEES